MPFAFKQEAGLKMTDLKWKKEIGRQSCNARGNIDSDPIREK